MLSNARPMVFLAVRDLEVAATFYRDVLGLRPVASDPFGAFLEREGVRVRLQKVEQVTLAPYTTAGFDVPDVPAAVAELAAAGVACERFPFLAQDVDGVWTSPDGAQVAWFRDPDGHLLSVSTTPR